MDALVKVPDKLSEVLGDVLELACGGHGGGGGNAPAGEKSISAASKIGAVTGVAIIRGRWSQRQARASVSSSNANTDSADSTASTTSSEVNNSGTTESLLGNR